MLNRPDGETAPSNRLCGMRIKLTDPVRTDDLVDFLRRCDCTVNVLAAGLLEAEPRELPIDPTLRQPELELDAYLGIWSALRGASVSLAT